MHLPNNAIAVLFLSFFVGIFAELVLRRMPLYGWISARYLFAESKTYEALGVAWFRKILLATPLRMFNDKIKLPKNPDLQQLKDVRKHIAIAEVSHWVGFVAMMVMTVFAWISYGPKIGVSFVLSNIVGNLYPCLLQQYHKRRLVALIAVMERRQSRT